MIRLWRALQARLIPDARAAWKLWSVRLSALGTAVYATALVWPDGVLALWNAMPPEIREIVPEPFGHVIAAILFAAVIAVRLIKQREEKADA